MTPPTDPNDRTYQYHHAGRNNVSLAIIGERVMSLDKRLAEHVVQDERFQERMESTQAEVSRALTAIELNLARWRGTAIAAVTAVSAVWAVAVVLIQLFGA